MRGRSRIDECHDACMIYYKWRVVVFGPSLLTSGLRSVELVVRARGSTMPYCTLISSHEQTHDSGFDFELLLFAYRDRDSGHSRYNGE